jgi:hypothetical protein
MPSNNWGPYFPQSQFSYQPPVGTGTPPPTGDLDPAQSPSGSVTGQSSTWEFANSEMAVEYETTNLVAALQDQTADPSPQTSVTPGTAPLGPSIGGKIPTLETIPSAPSGSFEMFGTPAISNTLAISESFAGVSPAEIAVFNFGATGNI